MSDAFTNVDLCCNEQGYYVGCTHVKRLEAEVAKLTNFNKDNICLKCEYHGKAAIEGKWKEKAELWDKATEMAYHNRTIISSPTHDMLFIERVIAAVKAAQEGELE